MDDPTPIVEALSKPPQRFRRTRIAVSVFFGVLTVALCVLWVRSRSIIDVAGISPASNCWLAIASSAREIELTILNGGPAGPTADWYGYHSIHSANAFGERVHEPRPKLKWVRTARELRLTVPIIAVVVAAAILAAVPWILMFLRTMLIATTLVAVVLGFGVWLAS